MNCFLPGLLGLAVAAVLAVPPVGVAIVRSATSDGVPGYGARVSGGLAADVNAACVFDRTHDEWSVVADRDAVRAVLDRVSIQIRDRPMRGDRSGSATGRYHGLANGVKIDIYRDTPIGASAVLAHELAHVLGGQILGDVDRRHGDDWRWRAAEEAADACD